MEVTINIETEKLFEALETLFKEEANRIEIMIKNKTIDKLDLFEVVNFNDKTTTICCGPKKCGIYVFMMVNDTLINNFNDVNYGAKTNKNLTDSYFPSNKCFYLGKSETDIEERIMEHLSQSSSTTYSLKLDDINRQHVKGNIALYAFVLKNEFMEFKKIILSVVESFLHDSLTPMVGTKRT